MLYSCWCRRQQKASVFIVGPPSVVDAGVCTSAQTPTSALCVPPSRREGHQREHGGLCSFVRRLCGVCAVRLCTSGSVRRDDQAEPRRAIGVHADLLLGQAAIRSHGAHRRGELLLAQAVEELVLAREPRQVLRAVAGGDAVLTHVSELANGSSDHIAGVLLAGARLRGCSSIWRSVWHHDAIAECEAAPIARGVVSLAPAEVAHAVIRGRLLVLVLLRIRQLAAEEQPCAHRTFPCSRAAVLRALRFAWMAEQHDRGACWPRRVGEPCDKGRDLMAVVLVAAEQPRDVIEEHDVCFVVADLLAQLDEHGARR